jgi:hypothetical protein
MGPERRLFNEICGQSTRREKYRGVFLVRPKAAPLEAPIRRFVNSIAAGLSTLSNRSTVAVETPDQHSLGVIE